MTDLDFIRISALMLTAALIGRSSDPARDGADMAERLFNILKEKEAE